MERHKCKLCSKAFANGRALGGHMRSHLAKLPIPPKIQQQQQQQEQLGERTGSASSLSSSEDKERESEERESEEKALVYGLRENPKKSFRLVDPEFLDAGSVVQDRESETESSRNPTRRRSKRTRKMGFAEDQGLNNPKLRKPSSTEAVAELEPVSSVSDTSREEDVALSLMMLSRDTWSSDDSDELRLTQTHRKYQCETCKKVFRSFQALGGHRTSHKKLKSCFKDNEDESPPPRTGGTSNANADQKIHQCPICYKVFGSGQALGGHKRSHFLTPPASVKFGECLVAKNSAKFGENLIDLNLPAPMEDDDLSQLEVSTVSEAEFINPVEH